MIQLAQETASAWTPEAVLTLIGAVATVLVPALIALVRAYGQARREADAYSRALHRVRDEVNGEAPLVKAIAAEEAERAGVRARSDATARRTREQLDKTNGAGGATKET